MNRRLVSAAWAVAALVAGAAAPAEATFSIVAVDTVNGVIGGAGASCIDNCFIIDDIIESIGAVHTQAYWLQGNKNYAHQLLAQGLTPDSIILLLVQNDVEGTPEYRQYGVVTLAGSGASAAYTGSATSDWAGHLTGPGYAVQGNILLGPEVIADMETAFLGTDGPLEAKLMAAMETTKRPGADNRCIFAGKSAISAFIKVVRPGDGGTPFLQEIVPTTTGSTDPIDVLHAQFDTWRLRQAAHPDSSTVVIGKTALDGDGQASTVITIAPRNWAGAPPVRIDSVRVGTTGQAVLSAVADNGDGTFACVLTAPLYGAPDDTLTVTVGAYYDFVTELHSRPAVTYYYCGDVTGDGSIKVSDLTFFVNFKFRGGPGAAFPSSADMNGDGQVKISDVTYIVAYLFAGGPPPICE